MVEKPKHKGRFMNCTLLPLAEQKYMGIATKILFQNHDAIDFCKLQRETILADIPNIDPTERFLALDSEFQADGFCYTPLVPVTAFEGDTFARFTRQAGDYYCFEVDAQDLNPQWFQACYAYMRQQNIQIDQSFDLEYYPEGYQERLKVEDESLSEHTLCLIFRKKDVAPSAIQ